MLMISKRSYIIYDHIALLCMALHDVCIMLIDLYIVILLTLMPIIK
jgi:hypothetical protein